MKLFNSYVSTFFLPEGSSGLMPARIGNNSFPGSFERQRIYIPWGLLDTLPWHNTRTVYVRGTRLRPGMYALNVRVQEIPSHLRIRIRSTVLRYITRSRLSLNIPGVPLTSPSKRESRVTRKRNGRKGSVVVSRREKKEETKKRKRRNSKRTKGKGRRRIDQARYFNLPMEFRDVRVQLRG